MNLPPLQSFGDLLRRYRLAGGMTQEMLAEQARMSLAAISKLERGARQRPYRATIALLSDALSLSAEDRRHLERAAGRGTQTRSSLPQAGGADIKLPVYFSSFVGRERDLATIAEMLAAHRLVSLVGAGGVGKSRLAVRAAEQFVAASSSEFDGIWFVDLSPVTDAAMVVPALASIVGAGHCRTLEALVAHLRSQRFLLILDNCEHLLESIAHLINRILAECPGAKLLATSRQALSLDGERVYRVPPLGQLDAVRLFRDRAEAIDSRFEVDDAGAAAVADICLRVDGIALGIELAAARTSAFSPAIIAEQLAEHFLLLRGNRTALSRHKTMRALFDWSYDLLGDRERELFRRLSVFARGFTLDLARALYAADERASEIPGRLASLVDKSFVQCDILLGPRYRLLEPARQYAREKLREHGEEDRAERAHAVALLALAEEFDAMVELISDNVWDGRIERERDNFRAAFEWALGTHGDITLAQRLAASKTATSSGFGSGEVRQWIDAAFATCDRTTPPGIAAQIALSAARAAIHFERDAQARVDACRRALGLQQADDLRGVATGQTYLGMALGYMGLHADSESVLREALATARAAGDHIAVNLATTALGIARLGSGDLREARELISDALRRSDAAGSERGVAGSAVALAEIEFAAGSTEAALELNERAMRSLRSRSDLVRLSTTLCNSSAYLIALGRYEEAWDNAQEALRRSLAIGSVNATLWALNSIAAIVALDGGREEDEALRCAANLLGFVDAAIAQRAKQRSYTEQQAYDKALSVLREVFGEVELAKLMAVGRAWREEEAVAEARAL